MHFDIRKDRRGFRWIACRDDGGELERSEPVESLETCIEQIRSVQRGPLRIYIYDETAESEGEPVARRILV